jgi:hypothetical protein
VTVAMGAAAAQERRSDACVESLFSHVVCVADATPAGHAARRQAAALATGGGTVRSVGGPRRAWRERDAVLKLARGADVLVLGAGTVPDAILEDTAMPVLLSRWLPVDADIAERILVVVDESVVPDRAAGVAGSMAALRDGTVVVMPSLARNAALQRSTAVSCRIVLESTGVWPDVSGDEVVREVAIASAVRDVDASLLVLPLGDAAEARAAAVSIARHVACPLLAIPSGGRRD